MKRFVLILMVFVLGSIAVADIPEPAILQKPYEWTADVQYTQPMQIVLKGKEDNKPRRYWYIILSVTNKSGQDVDFYPRCEVLTDTFELIPAERNTPPVVFEMIKKRHQDSYPLLELLSVTSNKLLEDIDNAKDIAIIWPDFDAESKNMSLFVGGLSNEIAIIEHPFAKETDGSTKRVFLRKTLVLDYGVSGDFRFRGDASLGLVKKSWAMR